MREIRVHMSDKLHQVVKQYGREAGWSITNTIIICCANYLGVTEDGLPVAEVPPDEAVIARYEKERRRKLLAEGRQAVAAMVPPREAVAVTVPEPVEPPPAIKPEPEPIPAESDAAGTFDDDGVVVAVDNEPFVVGEDGEEVEDSSDTAEWD